MKQRTLDKHGPTVSAVGLGCMGMSEAATGYPIAALQTEFSLRTRDVETEILPTCRELGIGLVPYSPLGHGFLSGKIERIC